MSAEHRAEMLAVQRELEVTRIAHGSLLDLLGEACESLSFQRALADDGSSMAILLARIDAALKAYGREPRCMCPCCEKARTRIGDDAAPELADALEAIANEAGDTGRNLAWARLHARAALRAAGRLP